MDEPNEELPKPIARDELHCEQHHELDRLEQVGSRVGVLLLISVQVFENRCFDVGDRRVGLVADKVELKIEAFTPAPAVVIAVGSGGCVAIGPGGLSHEEEREVASVYRVESGAMMAVMCPNWIMNLYRKKRTHLLDP